MLFLLHLVKKADLCTSFLKKTIDMQEDIKSRLTKVFHKVFKDETIVLTDEMTAKDVERWDSLSHLVLISDTEEEFGIRFKLKELIAMKNVGDFLRSIESKLSAN